MKTVQVHLIIWMTFNMLQNFTFMETEVLEIAGRVWKSPLPPPFGEWCGYEKAL